MLKAADVVVITKGDIVSQAEAVEPLSPML